MSTESIEEYYHSLFSYFNINSSNNNLAGLFEEIDPITMLLVFGFLVALIIIVSINIYLKVRKRADQQSLISDDNKSNDQHQSTLETSTLNPNGNIPVINDENQVQASRPNDLFNQQTKTGTESSSDPDTYLHNVMYWLQKANQTLTNEIQVNWLKQLNHQSSEMVIENGIFVSFVSLEQIVNPEFVQLKETERINENIISTMKITFDKLVMQVRIASDSNADANRFAIYNVILERFSALLKILGMTNESYFTVRMLERPETKAQIEGPLLGSKNKFMPDVIINAVLNIFTSTTFVLNFEKFPDFPKIEKNTMNVERKAAARTNSSSSSSTNSKIERKLLIKVVKANDLDLNPEDGHQIYCTIEVDEPFQMAKTTSVRDNSQSPVWDQHILFNLNERSKELLFELSDAQINRNKNSSDDNNQKSSSHKDQILGHAFVEIAELQANPSQTQNLKLMSETTKKDLGSLIVEFLLMEHKSTPQTSPTKDNINEIPSIKSNERILVKKQNSLQQQQYGQYQQQQQDFKSPSQKVDQHYIAQDGQHDIAQDENGHAAIITSSNQDLQSRGDMKESISPSRNHQTLESKFPAPRMRESSTLIRNLKKRFSFNRRSKSVDRQLYNRNNKANYEDYNNDDDFDSRNDYERARSVPNSREPSIVPERIKNGNKESVANLSQASAGTNIYEDSILILECQEKGGIIKHYVINDKKELKKSKFRSKGKKYHLFKNHLFVALHLPSARLCQVCHEKFPFRPGKQAYQCKDCKFYCHKPCHVQVEQSCPQSKIALLNLETIDGEHVDDITRLNTINNNYYYTNNNNNPIVTVTNAEDFIEE